MPTHHSAETKRLRVVLAALGHDRSCGTLEGWASAGMAPSPARRSLGRHGSTSEYPEGAVEQYAAVAEVMQRGRDTKVAALMLIGRGGLPASPELFREALRFLFSAFSDREQPPLDLAEEAYAEALGDRQWPTFAALMRKNVEAADLGGSSSPGSRSSIEAVVGGAFVNAFASMLGRQIPTEEAASEVAAAFGLLDGEMSDGERAARTRYIDAVYEDVINFGAMREAAEGVSPDRLQSAIREVRADEDFLNLDLIGALPPVWEDVIVVVLGLALVMLQELGGQEWFARAMTP